MGLDTNGAPLGPCSRRGLSGIIRKREVIFGGARGENFYGLYGIGFGRSSSPIPLRRFPANNIQYLKSLQCFDKSVTEH
jgi:hypothetical protein